MPNRKLSPNVYLVNISHKIKYIFRLCGHFLENDFIQNDHII
jgi:hypothetical protein